MHQLRCFVFTIDFACNFLVFESLNGQPMRHLAQDMKIKDVGTRYILPKIMQRKLIACQNIN